MVRGLGEKCEEVEKYRLVVTKQLWDVKYSIGNIVGNIVIHVYGARWVLETSGGTLCKLYDYLTTMLYLKLIQKNIECKL